jgi:hypothetical protein
MISVHEADMYEVLNVVQGLLSLNWRGQLTTVKPRLVDREEEK